MLFNSFVFLLFFPTVTMVYFLLPYKYRWIFLLIASYYFYMNWKPVYALLIFTSTFITYGAGRLIDLNQNNIRKKKLFLTLSLIINFGILFLYKYYNFINESVFNILSVLNIRWEVPNLDILLPVGISFYTFQAVGYTIDVYRGDLKSEKNLGIYALFVSFFPQLVAGPIERATNLLPQFREHHNFNYARAVSGFRLMLWGYFMKVVVADRLAVYVDAVYNNVEHHSGASLTLSSFLFAIQIYGDFAGYSLIAIGAAKIMGYNLMQNFNRPYFARSVSDFWRRWHISLSTWFKDYLYIPLGGNRVSFKRHLLNLFITFLLSGIWHGADWTFVIWGALHGLYLISGVLFQKYIKLKFPYFIDVGFNIVLVVFAWIFFRANSFSDAILIISKIFTNWGSVFMDKTTLFYSFFAIAILFYKEIADEFDLKIRLSKSNNRFGRYLYYLFMIGIILMFGIFDSSQFIYFQF